MSGAVPVRETRCARRGQVADHSVASRYDDATFGELVLRHRRELRGYCYRMLRSIDEVDDAVQETLLHAWRARATFAGHAKLRAWLYRIATNVCLDEIARRRRRARPHQRSDWFAPVVRTGEGQPEVVASRETEPDSVVTAGDSLTQACFVLALLTPRQRAVVILRDVLQWSASDTATLLDASVAAVNSALRRARTILHAARSTQSDIGPPRPTARRADGRVPFHPVDVADAAQALRAVFCGAVSLESPGHDRHVTAEARYWTVGAASVACFSERARRSTSQGSG
jgi:RNA polymerase sigma factor (sigma-70 family)